MKIKAQYYNYLKLLTSLICGLLLVHTIVKACGGDGWYWRDNPNVFMQPDIEVGQKRLEPFYFTLDFLNSGSEDNSISNLTSEQAAEIDENTIVWFKQLNGQIPKQTIYDFLYSSPNYTCLTEPNLKDFIMVLGSNPFVQALQKSKQNKALDYFMIAKANEFGVSELDNGWNYFNEWDVYGSDSIKTLETPSKLTAFIEKKLKKEKDPFYAQRLAFQLIRNCRYNFVPNKVDSLYLLYFDSLPYSDLKMAALNYATDALVNEGQQEKANYYAAQLFDVSEEKQLRAFDNFSKYIRVESVLPYCKSKEEQAKVYALYAFKDFYLNAAYIKQAVLLDPKNTSINDLLIREINKIDFHLMPQMHGYDYAEYNGYNNNEAPSIMNDQGETIRAYASENENTKVLLELIQTLKQSNIPYHSFYTLCLAHLQLIMENYPESKALLQSLTVSKLSDKLGVQHQLTAAILQIKTSNLRLPENQLVLNQNLAYLQSHNDKIYYKEFIPNAIKTMAVYKLIQNNDYAHAYLLAEKIETIYDSYELFGNTLRPQDIDTILAIRKHPKTAFEEMLVQGKKLSEKELRNIQGSLYLRQNNVAMANICFALDNPTYIPIDFAKLNTNPDGHPCYPYCYNKLTEGEAEYYSPEGLKAYNDRAEKLALNTNNYSITKTMLDLQRRIKQKKGNIAENYYQLACLYMEITYFGRAYTALQFNGNWSWNELEYNESKLPFESHYYGNTWAIPYYKLALKHSKNKELSAKCLYALFRCNRHLLTYNNIKDQQSDLPYLFRLHDQYSQTDYFKIKECWGLSAYVKEVRGK